jgi:glycosyltransferase involved in cell wall biosynthesis
MTIQCSFVVPCYKETDECIRKTVRQITEVASSIPLHGYEIILVNDGSSRQTFPDFTEPFISVIHHAINMGYGTSLLAGISRAQADLIAIVDADGTYPIDHFKQFFEFPADGFDMVVGKRRWADIPFVKRLPKYCLQCIASFIADHPIPDLNSGMRVFKKEIALSYKRMFPKRFSFTTTLTMICITNFLAVKYVDIPYYKRVGASRVRPVADTLRFLSLIFRLGLYFKPLRFFVPLSGLFFVLASARGIRDVLCTNYFGGLTLILFFMAFQTFFFGLIAEIINKK